MVDVYHLFKLGTSAARVLKATNGARNAALIFKNLCKPMAVMGVSGMADAAIEEAMDGVVKALEETK